jgi:type II secretory pathway component GspD/PulD (secretin)
MNRKLWYLSALLMCATTLVGAPRATVNWISTFEADGEAGLEISISKRVRFEELVSQNPPKITLKFPRVDFAQGKLAQSSSVPPMYRLNVAPDPRDEEDLLIEIYVNELPQYTTQWLGDDLLLVSWPAEAPYRRTVPRERRRLTNTVSLNFKEAELVDILRLLAFQNDLNIITGEDVEGEVTVSLRDVDLFEALDAILKVNGFDWFEQENIIVVKPKDDELDGELETRVFKLEYVDAGAMSSALTNVLSSKGKVQIFSPVMKGMTAGGAGAGGGAGGAGGAAGGGGGGGLAAALGGGGAGGGAVGGSGGGAGGGAGAGGGTTYDHLVITEISPNFAQIIAIIGELDKPIPQINIAVKFIETKLTNEERLGINWDMRASLSAPSFSADATSATDNLLDIGSLALGGGTLRFATLSLPLFSALMEILSTDDDTRLIQEPNVTTFENTSATVKVGTTYPVITGSSTTTGATNTSTVTTEDVDIDVSLTVQPRISEGKYIQMTIDAQVMALVGFAGPNSDFPITSERSTTNQVMVENGETLLIGGLIFDNITEGTTTAPIFGRLPILKRFFTHTRTSVEQRELLIFITPNIVVTN